MKMLFTCFAPHGGHDSRIAAVSDVVLTSASAHRS